MRTAKQLDEVIALRAFPNTFVMFQERRKPLKIGIHQDLAAALGEVEHLSAELQYYTRNVGYLKAQRAGAKRFDLDGNEAGSVTEGQALNAQGAIARIRAKRKQKSGRAEPVAEAARSRWSGGAEEAAKRRRAAA